MEKSCELKKPAAAPRGRSWQPPDGGYGWVVVFSSWMLLILTMTMNLAFSMLYIEFTRVFQKSKGELGLIHSIHTSLLFSTGIIGAVFVRRYGPRSVAIVGALIAALGAFMSSFATNVPTLYATYGVISGLGTGILLLPAFVNVQEWFSKRRPLAAGLAASGVSMVNLLAPPMTRLLISHYGWRGTLIIISGCLLNGVPLAALFRPSPIRKNYKKEITLNPSTICQSIWDFRLLKKVKFLLYVSGVFFNFMSTMTFLQHIPSKAFLMGIPLTQASLLLTCTGVTAMVFRVPFSFLANIKCTNRILMFSGGSIFAGLIMILVTLGKTFPTVATLAAGIGIGNACFSSVQQIIVVELLGIEKLTRGQAIVSLLQGLSTLCAVPLAGLLYDVSLNYDIPFLVMGSIQIFGGFLVILSALSHKWDENKLKEGSGHMQDSKTSQIIMQRVSNNHLQGEC